MFSLCCWLLSVLRLRCQQVIIWQETSDGWENRHEHVVHESSVNSIAWIPHEFDDLTLACASSDGDISILSSKGVSRVWKNPPPSSQASSRDTPGRWLLVAPEDCSCPPNRMHVGELGTGTGSGCHLPAGWW